MVGSVALMNEVCDEKRFSKIVSAGLNEVRNGTNDGLFTAHNGVCYLSDLTHFKHANLKTRSTTGRLRIVF